jgi:cell division protease FtsH
MVLRYGMSDALGNVAYDRDRQPFLQPAYPLPQERIYSEHTAEEVDRGVQLFIDRAFALATAVLQRNRALLERTAAALLATETLSEPEIERLKREIEPVPELALPSAQRPAEIAAVS